MTILATTKLPCWQDPDGDGIDVTIEQRPGYGGISLMVGKLEVLVERDSTRGIVVRIWDTDAQTDADFEHDFPEGAITKKEE